MGSRSSFRRTLSWVPWPCCLWCLCWLSWLAAPALPACHSGDLTAITSAPDAGRDQRDAGDAIDATANGQLLPCLEANQCPEGQACSIERAGCVEPRCGLPPLGSGTVPAAGECQDAAACAAGLTCVTIRQRLPTDEDQYTRAAGRCLLACDPCQPSCPVTASCFELEQGGGFCSARLAGEGHSCLAVPCGAGLSCEDSGGFSQVGPSCRRFCRPEPLLPKRPFGAFSSPDCAADEICRTNTHSSGSSFSVCQPGLLVETGERCGGRRNCRYPEECLLTCTPADCDADCPAGAGCFEPLVHPLGTLLASQCIRDGEMPFGWPCAEDRNCAAGLTCQGGPTPAEHSCL